MPTATTPRTRTLKPRPGSGQTVRFMRRAGLQQLRLTWTCGESFFMGFREVESFFKKLEKKNTKGENPVVDLDKLNPQFRGYVGQLQGRYLVIAAPRYLNKVDATGVFNYQALKNTIAKLRED